MSTTNLTVLFDGGCPLCSREIAHYQKLTSLIPIQWVDITRDDGMLRQFAVTREDAMAEFHVLDETGQIHKGADGFVVLWQGLPYFRWLASICQTLHLLPLMRYFYTHFARWHYKRRCNTGVCG
jgi:predicted DCC family thiol-disulfide oxidoreductase YuxK